MARGRGGPSLGVAPAQGLLSSPCGRGCQRWKRSEHVAHYLELVDAVPHRAEGESVLLEHVPLAARRILDLGTGDGRLLALVRATGPRA